MRTALKEQLKQAKRKKLLGQIRRQDGLVRVTEQKRIKPDRYPKVLVDDRDGDPEFVKLIQSANEKLDIQDEEVFPWLEQEFYASIKCIGAKQAFANYQLKMEELEMVGDEFGRNGTYETSVAYGERLFKRIPKEVLRRFLPQNGLFVDFVEREIVLRFSSALSQKLAMGKVHYSRRRPTIRFDHNDFIVGFSAHAMARIHERLDPRGFEYASSRNIHSIFTDCVYFEPLLLNRGQPAFAVFACCNNPKFASYEAYVQRVFGESNIVSGNGKCYYRVGYCPVVLEEGFAKAKTFLYPGFNGTPEHELILRSNISHKLRNELLKDTKELDAQNFLGKTYKGPIPWFHQNGIPQVMQFKQNVFEPYTSTGGFDPSECSGLYLGRAPQTDTGDRWTKIEE